MLKRWIIKLAAKIIKNDPELKLEFISEMSEAIKGVYNQVRSQKKYIGYRDMKVISKLSAENYINSLTP